MKLLKSVQKYHVFYWNEVVKQDLCSHILLCSYQPNQIFTHCFLIQKWLANAEKSPYLTKTQVQTQSKYFGKQLFCPCIFSSVINYA